MRTGLTAEMRPTPREGLMVAGEVWLSKVSASGISEWMLYNLAGEIGECAHSVTLVLLQA